MANPPSFAWPLTPVRGVGSTAGSWYIDADSVALHTGCGSIVGVWAGYLLVFTNTVFRSDGPGGAEPVHDSGRLRRTVVLLASALVVAGAATSAALLLTRGQPEAPTSCSTFAALGQELAASTPSVVRLTELKAQLAELQPDPPSQYVLGVYAALDEVVRDPANGAAQDVAVSAVTLAQDRGQCS